MSSPTSPTTVQASWRNIPGANVSCPNQVSDERTSVPAAIERLTTNVNEQLKIIGELESRFGWVLRDSPGPICKNPEEAPRKLTLAETIDRINERVIENTSVLRSMISRSEL